MSGRPAQWGSPPERLENAKRVWIFVDRGAGKGLGITLFETEEELARATRH